MNKLDTIKSLAIELIKDGISHKNIVKAINQAILDESKQLPKIPVLCNRSSGGYHLTDYFKHFVAKQNDLIEGHHYQSNEYRIYAASIMSHFGRHICETFPNLKELIKLYLSTDITTHVLLASKYSRSKSMIDRYSQAKQRLETFLQNTSDSHIQSSTSMSTFTFHHFFDKNTSLVTFSRDSLHKFLDNLDYKQIIKGYITQIQGVENDSMWINLPECVKVSLIEFASSEICKKIMRLSYHHEKSFMESLVHYGEKDPTIWNNQSFYGRCAMTYLSMIYHSSCELNESQRAYEFYREISQQINTPEIENLEETIGLMCASSQYATLAINYVPKYIDWTICEYDGMESIMYM